ncbi:MAG: hypothetical protein ACYTX0_61370, partial [Nostoc sp.]
LVAVNAVIPVVIAVTKSLIFLQVLVFMLGHWALGMGHWAFVCTERFQSIGHLDTPLASLSPSSPARLVLCRSLDLYFSQIKR